MAEHLGEVRKIDLEKSEIDTDRSKPEQGIYFFRGDPVVITTDSYKRPETCPDYVYQFCTTSFEGRTLKKWIYQLHYDFVQHGEDLIFPEGCELDAEGHWIFGDAVLMKIPLEVYMRRKIKAHKTQDDAKQAVRREFNAQVAASDKKLGKGAVLTEEEIEQYLTDDELGLP